MSSVPVRRAHNDRARVHDSLADENVQDPDGQQRQLKARTQGQG